MKVQAQRQAPIEPQQALTGTDFPLRLERGDAREAAHREEVEEDLGGVEYDGGFRDDHLLTRTTTALASYNPVAHEIKGEI